MCFWEKNRLIRSMFAPILYHCTVALAGDCCLMSYAWRAVSNHLLTFHPKVKGIFHYQLKIQSLFDISGNRLTRFSVVKMKKTDTALIAVC